MAPWHYDSVSSIHGDWARVTVGQGLMWCLLEFHHHGRDSGFSVKQPKLQWLPPSLYLSYLVFAGLLNLWVLTHLWVLTLVLLQIQRNLSCNLFKCLCTISSSRSSEALRKQIRSFHFSSERQETEVLFLHALFCQVYSDLYSSSLILSIAMYNKLIIELLF